MVARFDDLRRVDINSSVADIPQSITGDRNIGKFVARVKIAGLELYGGSFTFAKDGWVCCTQTLMACFRNLVWLQPSCEFIHFLVAFGGCVMQQLAEKNKHLFPYHQRFAYARHVWITPACLLLAGYCILVHFVPQYNLGC